MKNIDKTRAEIILEAQLGEFFDMVRRTSDKNDDYFLYTKERWLEEFRESIQKLNLRKDYLKGLEGARGVTDYNGIVYLNRNARKSTETLEGVGGVTGHNGIVYFNRNARKSTETNEEGSNE